MNLSLTPELESLIQQEITKGKYATPDEVIEAALNLLNQRNSSDQWAIEIGEKVDVAVAQIDRGEGLDGNEVFAGLKAKLLLKLCE
jgi:antitoxin ParD1/3/4